MAGTSYINLIPVSELTPGQATRIRDSAITALLAIAAKELNLSADKLVVRDIRADVDLDYTNEDWHEVTGATANAYETMSTGTMADQRWIGFFGVKDDEDCLSCTAIRFNVGGGDRAIIQLQALNGEDAMVGFFQSLIVIPPNAPYTISRYVRDANAATHLVLKGVVIEPRGKVVSP